MVDVVNTVATDGTDPDTLFVKYRNSGTDNASISLQMEGITSGGPKAATAVVSSCFYRFCP